MSVKRRDTIQYCCCLKGVFVEEQLADVLKVINPDILDVRYSFETDDTVVIDESVWIDFKGVTKCINVTGDSYKGIVLDVLKKV